MNILDKKEALPPEDAAIEWLVLLQSSAMTDLEEEAFFEWLQSDPSHQQAFVSMESLWQRGGALSKTRRVEESEALLAPSSVSGGLSWFRSMFGLSGFHTATFASVCAVFLVFTFINVSPQHELSSFQTAFGEQKTVELSEGSVLTLNAGSNVSVSLASAGSREVTLKSGEVFFDVAHDSERPFTIKTDEGYIVVLGTKFSVRKSDGKTQITVVEGRVGLLPGDSEWRGQESAVVLTANQQMELDALISEPTVVDTSKALSWRRGQLQFDGDTLLTVIARLNDYYNSSLSLANKELESKRVVAVFPLKNDFNTNLGHLKRALLLSSIETSEGEVILSLSAD